MDSNSVSPMPDTAPIAEFDKSPPTPPEETLPMDDLPPPPVSAGSLHGDEKENGNTHMDPFGLQSLNKHGYSPHKQNPRYDNEWGCTNWCEYVIVVVLAVLLLIASLTLTLFWIIYYREGFSWDTNPKLQFNLHPVLMVAGFITFSGFSILLYRICRCFRRIYVKLIHTIFHALAIPCIVVGFLAVLEYHNNTSPPIPNFYSMHSWLGFITMGLFALQFVFGFFSFLILLCCEGHTAAFRASLVPIHASFGLTTFMLAIATCLTGLTEKAIFTLGSSYGKLPEEALVMNAIAMVLVALAIMVGYVCTRENFSDEYAKGNLEGLVMNVLAVVLVALGILISYTVRSTTIRPDDSTVFHASKMTKVMSASSRASAGPY